MMGLLVLVSHDVDFVNPIVNKVIEVKNKTIKVYFGNLDDFIQKKKIEEELNEKKTSINKKSFRATIKSEKITEKSRSRKRQKFYSLTKEIKARINFLESEISNLENQKKILEELFNSTR